MAYINIEPGNGGLVLNISDKGLCFQSIAPVERNAKIHFSLENNSKQAHGGGEIRWFDEVQRIAGLRFTVLSDEARSQIQSWTAYSMSFLDEFTARSVLSPAKAPAPEPRIESTTAPDGSLLEILDVVTSRMREILSGFSGGLAIGLLVAALVAAGFSFHSYRHEFGESLIQLGQWLSGRSPEQVEGLPSQAQSAIPTAQSIVPASPSTLGSAPFSTAIPAAQPIVPASPSTLGSAPFSTAIPAAQAIMPASPSTLGSAPFSTAFPLPEQTALRTAAKPHKHEAETFRPETSITVFDIHRPTPTLFETRPLTLPEIALPAASDQPISKVLGAASTSIPAPGLTRTPNSHVADAGAGDTATPSQMYFEVGKFRQELWARKTTDDLSRLGYPAAVVTRSGLWKNSFYVLVGPYVDRERAETVHRNLISRGFQARPFERGSRHFNLSSPVVVNGMPMPAGDFVISWESYVPDAKVKFLQKNFLVTAVEGRWVQRGTRTYRDAFVYQNGSHRLLEIRFAGMTKVLVFASSS